MYHHAFLSMTNYHYNYYSPDENYITEVLILKLLSS
jgi:hypothetical protein